MNSVRPPEDFGLVLEVGWDHSGPDRTIDVEVNVDHEWFAHVCVDSSSRADAQRGKAGRQRLHNILPTDASRARFISSGVSKSCTIPLTGSTLPSPTAGEST